MKIGIIVAMDKELALLLEVMGNHSVDHRYGLTMYTGQMGGVTAVATTCGIGKVNAAIGAMSLIEAHHPDAIINSGVAGGTGQGASILDVVLASAVAYHDVWCGPGTEWGEAAGCPLMLAAHDDATALAQQLGVKCGLIASGDIFVSRKEDTDRILSLYPHAIAVDMESAAIAQVCHMRTVPMYCLRVVSDTPGAADNIAQYENFWSDAPSHTFKAVEALVSLLAR